MYKSTVTSAALAAGLFLLSPFAANAQGVFPPGLVNQSNALSQVNIALSQGARGDQVKLLQAFLAGDSDVYPEGLITGYFGSLTTQAVRRFQAKHGIVSSGTAATTGYGVVGPRTRGQLNKFLKDTPIVFGTSSTTGTTTVVVVDENNAGNGNGKPCAVVPPGHLVAPGWLRKQGGNAPIVPPCQVLPPGIARKLGLPVSTTTPPGQGDKTAPVLSSIAVGGLSSSAATITWTTNENSNSSVSYGTTVAYGSASSSATLVTGQSIMLTGLSPVTLYHYQVKSVDGAGNTATSSDLTFTTSALPDTTAPSLSNIVSTVSPVFSTTTITWTTDEAATSKVYYGTSTPLPLSTALMVGDTTLVTNHSLLLSGLASSTLHYFLVVSADGVGNTATSTEQSFTTSP